MNIFPNPIEPRPIFTTQNITKGSTAASDKVLLEHNPIRSHEVNFIHNFCTNTIKQCTQASKSRKMTHRAMEIPTFVHHTILSVNDITYSLHTCSQTQPPGGFQLYIFQVFTRNYFSLFAHTFFYGEHDAIHILP